MYTVSIQTRTKHIKNNEFLIESELDNFQKESFAYQFWYNKIVKVYKLSFYIHL